MDRDEVQSDKPTEEIVALGDLEAKLRAFGWDVETVDGHDHAALRAAFARFQAGAATAKALVGRGEGGAGQGGAQCRMVVPVNRLDVPAERTELRLEVAERDDFLGRLVGLDLVAVHDDPEPAEPLVRGGLERLPVLSFLELPVARHHDDQPLPAEPTLRERDPTALGDAHAERAGARLDPRHSDVRVPVEPAQATEAKQALARDDAEREERGVQARHVVALGREEDVAAGIVESALDDVQLVEQELRDDVERAERRAEVTGAGALHRDERVQPAGIGKERQLRVGVDVGGAYAV